MLSLMVWQSILSRWTRVRCRFQVTFIAGQRRTCSSLAYMPFKKNLLWLLKPDPAKLEWLTNMPTMPRIISCVTRQPQAISKVLDLALNFWFFIVGPMHSLEAQLRRHCPPLDHHAAHIPVCSFLAACSTPFNASAIELSSSCRTQVQVQHLKSRSIESSGLYQSLPQDSNSETLKRWGRLQKAPCFEAVVNCLHGLHWSVCVYWYR